MPMRCLLVDDEPLARERLRELLDEADADVNVVAEAEGGKEAVSLIHDCEPDVVFLDVQMPVLDGFDVVDLLPSNSADRPHIVFVTAYDEYAIQAFEVHALDYVTKPVRLERLNRTLSRVRDALSDQQEALDDLRTSRRDRVLKRLTVHVGRRLRVVPLDNVRWIEADDGFVFAYTEDGRYRTELTLSDLEERLPPDDFVRTHRSTIVNLDAAYEFVPEPAGTATLRLRDGTEVKVARRRADEVEAALT
ncbi:LytR/AlgR family response regulator transcription factor [Salinibacter ruber]|uniref:LytR/AlgR family response regulator transcription factor n=1 Tax=Salinibacter ruber TaxID=146919 RepID=UPI00216A4765|nr:LytTR family transcriptional regulator DNA-binding domain-containing protein [Salinibacter ruber]MCS3684379.1 two-component system LytT family response regulator [Salinibacter ruber]MCS3751082.1 two-component system LytT family response regulator [Salinibacter ruber]MCS3757189.1 two-component system LytT family response regulator [Salinibacter ruber]MCS3862384.1 two-component system LytT family response regulator [Salinibacter ruber]MCS3955662.1 two-component system LytT family response reg